MNEAKFQRDPNKRIVMVNPHTKLPLFEHFSADIIRLMDSPCFDNDHQYGGNRKSLLQYYDFVLKQCNHDGLWLEFGVQTGFTINTISQYTTNTVYGFDSFLGLPEDWHDDHHYGKKGSFSTGGVKPSVNVNVELVVGMFADTLPIFIRQHNKRCSVIHIDCDLYSSTKTIFDHLAPHISQDTVILFDEYWYLHGWDKHEYKAFMEFVQEYNKKYEYVAHTDRGCATVRIL